MGIFPISRSLFFLFSTCRMHSLHLSLSLTLFPSRNLTNELPMVSTIGVITIDVIDFFPSWLKYPVVRVVAMKVYVFSHETNTDI